MNKTKLATLIRWLVVIATPFLLTTLMVRVLIAWQSPSYPAWEYERIPPDRYGFSPAERLELAEATLDYLQRDQPAADVIYLLEDLRLPGTDAPVYNPAEIGHMLDVKIVADAFKTAMWVLLVMVVGGLTFLFAQSEIRLQGAKALWQGGVLTVTAVILVIVFMLIGWGLFFTLFHNLFFDPGTWTFAYSDSLIRLFPEQFWFDFALIWTGSILALGAIGGAIGWVLSKKMAHAHS
ncbi:MAG: TIGR01906 family membrane protein [Chloroflexi bacterium]|nr:MAG: TIGR01906 family membrane protein [Chloroflexota bacterium]PIE81185.1 MAG: TIGR01906 family membrane protein [Chloroflexota bacterium]